MFRRLFLLALPLVVVGAACANEDSPAIEGASQRTTSTTAGSSTTSTTTGASTPTTAATTSDGTPLSGPPGTSGSLRYTLAAERSEFCYRLAISGPGEATGAHLHRQTGEVALGLTPPGADGKVDTCVAGDALLLEELQAKPTNFSVDVHTPKGVLQGSLG